MSPRRGQSSKPVRLPGHDRPRPPRPARGGDVASSKQRIHAAALRLFARHGYECVSLQRIADEVGLHKSSLFHHYRGKLELATEVFDGAMQRVAELVRPLAAQDPPTLDALFEVSDGLVEFFSEEPDAARLIFTVTVAARDEELNLPIDPDESDPTLEFFRTFWDWLERAKRAGVTRAANSRQAILNLVGVMLYYPAVAGRMGAISGPEPFSAKARRIRKQELRHLLRGVLAPE